MISRIILVNVFIFITFILIRAFTPGNSGGFYQSLLSWTALSSETINLLKRPWSIISHMFLHVGFWHIFWNMLLLYWFGRISGDLIGDRKILPIYLLGGLAGAFFYLIFAVITGQPGIAYGASAAVMAFVVASGFLAPEYTMHLILIGPVRLKYIALFLVAMDLIMISEANNTGGRIAHLGGALFGGGYVYLLRNGTDLASPLIGILDSFAGIFSKSPVRKKIQVSKRRPPESRQPRENQNDQARIDAILDKINASGYESLTQEEKEFLFLASKK
jgi:membrane associated rhomboid family serine protease